MAQRGVRNPSSLTGTSGQGDLDSLRAAAPGTCPDTPEMNRGNIPGVPVLIWAALVSVNTTRQMGGWVRNLLTSTNKKRSS